eukprot:753680-Hanusia_phi.AAC.2
MRAARAKRLLLACLLACHVVVLPAIMTSRAIAGTYDTRKQFKDVPLEHAEELGWDGSSKKYSWQDVSEYRRIIYVGISPIDDNNMDQVDMQEEEEVEANATSSSMEPMGLDFLHFTWEGDIEDAIKELEKKVGPAPIKVLTEEEMQARMLAANFSESDYLFDKSHGYPAYNASAKTPYPILPHDSPVGHVNLLPKFPLPPPMEELKLSSWSKIESEVQMDEGIFDREEYRVEYRDDVIEIDCKSSDYPQPGDGYIRLMEQLNITEEYQETGELTKRHRQMLAQAQRDLIFCSNFSRPHRGEQDRRPGAGPKVDISLVQAHARKVISEGMHRDACPLDMPGLMPSEDNAMGLVELAK